MSGTLKDRAFSAEEMAEFEAQYWQDIFLAWQERKLRKDGELVRSIMESFAKGGKADA